MQAQVAADVKSRRFASQTPPSRIGRPVREIGLTTKQIAFAKQYARLGNGTAAAKAAGYKGTDNQLCAIAWENQRKPNVASAIAEECARLDAETDFSAGRVRRRLDRLSHGAEADQQYGNAIRAEELIGKSINMFVDQSIQLKGNLSSDHLEALLNVARARQAQPLNLGDSSARKRDVP